MTAVINAKPVYLFHVDPESRKVVNNIALRRKQLGLTQQALANRMHLSRSTIAKYERREYCSFELATLVYLAQHLNCNLQVTFTERKEKPNQ